MSRWDQIFRQLALPARHMGQLFVSGYISGVLDAYRSHQRLVMFVSVPPHVATSDLMQRAVFFLQNPDGVSGNPQALLGAEILGPRIFLHDQW